MPALRAYIAAPELPTPVTIGDVLTLDREESHHLVKVRRAREGEKVDVLDGAGHVYFTTLLEAKGKRACLRVEGQRPARPAPFRLSLGLAVLKGKAMEHAIQKATELGAARILPLATENAEVHLDPEREREKRAKWHTVAVESCKQCGNTVVPSIEAVHTLEGALLAANGEAPPLRLIASLHERPVEVDEAVAAYRQREHRLPQEALVLVGPEGDFTPAEYAAAARTGCTPVTLGPTVLRAETAVAVALGLAAHALRRAQP